MLALATIAFGFCSCEDVPMPYGYPQGSTDPTNPDLPAEGEGTLESPYNVAAAHAVIAGGDFDPEKQFYIKGIVTSIDETDGFPNSLAMSPTTSLTRPTLPTSSWFTVAWATVAPRLILPTTSK